MPKEMNRVMKVTHYYCIIFTDGNFVTAEKMFYVYTIYKDWA